MDLRWFKILLMLLPASVLGCDGVSTSTTLENNDWVLVSFQDADGNATEVDGQMASTLYFEKAGRTVTGTVRCNQLRSTYRASKRRISFGDIAVTEMGCGPDPEGQEQFVIDVLSSLSTYKINDDTLLLQSGSGKSLTYSLI